MRWWEGEKRRREKRGRTEGEGRKKGEGERPNPPPLSTPHQSSTCICDFPMNS